MSGSDATVTLGVQGQLPAKNEEAMTKPVIRIAPNNQVFDLPVMVAIEEGLFEAAGLDVKFTATHADREKDAIGKPIMARLKEQMFDCGSADSYNVCEWASIDRLERGARSGNIAAPAPTLSPAAFFTDAAKPVFETETAIFSGVVLAGS